MPNITKNLKPCSTEKARNNTSDATQESDSYLNSVEKRKQKQTEHSQKPSLSSLPFKAPTSILSFSVSLSDSKTLSLLHKNSLTMLSFRLVPSLTATHQTRTISPETPFNISIIPNSRDSHPSGIPLLFPHTATIPLNTFSPRHCLFPSLSR